MTKDRDNDPDRRLRGGGADPRGFSGHDSDERPYNTYSSRPRGLLARLRGESDFEITNRELREAANRPARSDRGRGRGRRAGAPAGAPAVSGSSGNGVRGFMRTPLFGTRKLTPRRILKSLIAAIVFWVGLSVVLFFISAWGNAGNLPKGAEGALSSGSPMLFSANNVLVLGLDNRPKSGYSSKEKGANYSEKDANTDSIMIWRIGGGVSRRLSIARDTLVNIPGYGQHKINAAWQLGGPAATIKVVENLTGIKINHLIVVDLGNFAKFIDDIGGVSVKTPRICSEISGGAKDGGFTLNLRAGTHHLNGTEALTLARTRENSCNAAYNDFARQKMQQEIMNGMRSQLISLHTFFHLPWASWDAPRTIQTDMGPLTLMQLFISSELGGSSKPHTLTETGSMYNGEDVEIPNAQNVTAQVNYLLHGN